MNFLELAKKRYSSRSYKKQLVEEEKLLQVLEAARIAPSAANYQPWHFIVVKDAANLIKISSIYKRDWIKTAPVVIIACGDKNKAWVRATDKKNHTDIDISIAIDHITLQATELELATCWICNFDVQKCVELFNIPENIEPIALIPLGYPADTVNILRHDLQRKKLQEIIHSEKW